MPNIPQITIALAAGIQTFFSPCSFPLLPAYLSYYIGNDQEQINTLKTITHAIAGFTTIIAILTTLTFTIGKQISSFFTKITPLIATALIALGIAWMLNKKPLSISNLKIELPKSSAYLFGNAYAITSIACMFPILLSVVLTTINQGTTTLITTFLAYLLGMATMMALATLAATLSNQILLQKFKNYMNYVTRTSGLIILLAGTYLLVKSTKYM